MPVICRVSIQFIWIEALEWKKPVVGVCVYTRQIALLPSCVAINILDIYEHCGYNIKLNWKSRPLHHRDRQQQSVRKILHVQTKSVFCPVVVPNNNLQMNKLGIMIDLMHNINYTLLIRG